VCVTDRPANLPFVSPSVARVATVDAPYSVELCVAFMPSAMLSLGATRSSK